MKIHSDTGKLEYPIDSYVKFTHCENDVTSMGNAPLRRVL